MTEDAPRSRDVQNLEQFAANVAHDFNNLLTGILGNLELMETRAKRTGALQFAGYIDGARNSAVRAAAFAQRLLAFSGRGEQEAAAVDLNLLLQDALEPLRAQGFQVIFMPAAEPMVLVCDSAQAELALHELLRNAAEALPEHGEVEGRLEKHNGAIRLTIRDAGAGMAPEILARALEPFFSTRPNGAGKGLGLPIAERFVRQLGGTMTLASEPGVGTTICMNFPLRA